MVGWGWWSGGGWVWWGWWVVDGGGEMGGDDEVDWVDGGVCGVLVRDVVGGGQRVGSV